MWGSSSSSSLCAWSLCGRCKRGASRGSGWVGGISVPAPRAGVPVRAFVRRSGLARSLATMWGKYLSDADDAPFSVRKKWTLDTDFDNLKKNVREQRAISTLAGRRLVFRGLSRKVSRRTSDCEFQAGRSASERTPESISFVIHNSANREARLGKKILVVASVQDAFCTRVAQIRSENPAALVSLEKERRPPRPKTASVLSDRSRSVAPPRDLKRATCAPEPPASQPLKVSRGPHPPKMERREREGAAHHTHAPRDRES